MHSILIGDIGSTKGQWAWLGKERQVIFETSGYNPAQQAPQEFASIIAALRRQCPEPPGHIYYYGSGALPGRLSEQVTDGLQAVFSGASVQCQSDLLGAAFALSVGEDGVIGILGTGSNSCQFDGGQIQRQIPSLGFPLGDEGSGADIGRACVRAFYYGLMPKEVHQTFLKSLPVDRSEFLDMYREHPAPNRFLASLAPLVDHHRDTSFMSILLHACFLDFVRLHIVPYNTRSRVHLVGGIAFTFRDILREILEAEGCVAGTIVRSPLPGLITYHQSIQYG
jgi:N-acetylglucosamine kinase-like BadF-type ATPase